MDNDDIVTTSYFVGNDGISQATVKVGRDQYVPFSEIAEEIFSKMYFVPVLVVCLHCNSVNAITNPVCCRCGVGLGGAKVFSPRKENYAAS